MTYAVQLPTGVYVRRLTRQRCACCGADRVPPETRIIVSGEAYCVPCDQGAIRVAPQVGLTREARAFLKRRESAR